MLELKGKVEAISPESKFEGPSVSQKVAKSAEEAIMALVQLGFKYDDAAKSVHAIAKELPEKECTAENLIRKSISSMN